MVVIVTGLRCLWRHTATSNSRFKSNVSATFFDTTHIIKHTGGVTSPKFEGGTILTLGKQQYFFLGRRISKRKMTRYAKHWGAWPVWDPRGYPYDTHSPYLLLYNLTYHCIDFKLLTFYPDLVCFDTNCWQWSANYLSHCWVVGYRTTPSGSFVLLPWSIFSFRALNSRCTQLSCS